MCKCQRCGKKYRMDLLVPDSVWKQIKPLGKSEGAGLLCPSCIVVKIEKVYGYTAMKVSFIY